jgi:predicted NAD/FAD-dependent oxidoreductase
MSDRVTQLETTVDVAIVGAGLAGLTCANKLKQAGLKVVILEKSRGVGGRVDTRRLHDTRVDRGLPCLEVQGEQTQPLIEQLCREGILQLWQGDFFELYPPDDWRRCLLYPRYIAPQGMTAIAKFLARDLDIQKQFRAIAIAASTDSTWQLAGETTTREPLTAKAVVVAIPAPQATILLKPLAPILPTEFWQQLASVDFNPCLTVSAGYGERQAELANHKPSWQTVKIISHPDLAKLIWDSSKRENKDQAVLIAHSKGQFAEFYLDAEDLQPAGERLLTSAAELLYPWLASPQWLQVHRWRYALPKTSLTVPYLMATQPMPLICCGDWCGTGDNSLENALRSGLAAADRLLEYF